MKYPKHFLWNFRTKEVNSDSIIQAYETLGQPLRQINHSILIKDTFKNKLVNNFNSSRRDKTTTLTKPSTIYLKKNF